MEYGFNHYIMPPISLLSLRASSFGHFGPAFYAM